ncbi:uncharacterized protein N7496_011675 [Penicillium cataractarum]|uniref:Uncharacterized protein n=1 Tax=Penicillium cataractarum TaxID=2100454 RepID=A0A9W9UVU1_9EURO|nr:uncharacterized protein N7496_011675 [Penicillium cataractarum]KAJ5359262.1 hypothetical protein N7496_011675 [Penicillium cataractarum]
MKGFQKGWEVVKGRKASISHPLAVGKKKIANGVKNAAKKVRRRISTWRKGKKETWGFNQVYPHEPPQRPRSSSSLSGVTTGGEEEDEEDGNDELSERFMGRTSPDNWAHDIAGLPVLVGQDPAQVAVESSQDNADSRTVARVPTSSRHAVRSLREPTQQVVYLPPQRRPPSPSTVDIHLPPNEEASTLASSLPAL